MSIPVALTALAERIDEYGTVAYLMTVGEDSTPHIVSVRVGWDGSCLSVGAGRRTSSNVERNPIVTLLWPAPPGAGYSLIVDGRSTVKADPDAPTVTIEPTAAVLHRTPEGDPDAPSCVTVLAKTPT